MAYDNYHQKNPYSSRNNRHASRQQKPAEPAPEFPSETYVDTADKLMRNQAGNITTSKLRNLLSLFMDIYNVEILRTEETLTRDSLVKLQLARIRIAYECGRDDNTRNFVTASYLLPWLAAIGTSREKAIQYIHYLEALVAYHRFYDGKEN